MSITLNPSLPLQVVQTVRPIEQPQTSQELTHIAQHILSRGEALEYKSSLASESRLYNELAVKLSHEGRIVELSNGVKINTTKERLRGGFLDVLAGTLVSILSSDTVQNTIKEGALKAWKYFFPTEEAPKLGLTEVQKTELGVKIGAKLQTQFEKAKGDGKDKFLDHMKKMNGSFTSALKQPEDEDCIEDLEKFVKRLNKYEDLISNMTKVQEEPTKETIEKAKESIALSMEYCAGCNQIGGDNTGNISTTMGNVEIGNTKNVKNNFKEIEKNYEKYAETMYDNCEKFIGKIEKMDVSGSGSIGVNFGDNK